MRISDWSSDVCSSDLSPASCSATRLFRSTPVSATRKENTMSASVFKPLSLATALVLAAAPQASLQAAQPAAASTPVYDVGELDRSEEHTSELQSLMRISYAVFCLKKKTTKIKQHAHNE